MKEIIPNLFEIRATNVSEKYRTYNYLLVRPSGNILLSSLPFENRLDEQFGEIKSKGKLIAQFLGDRHNASSGCDDIRKSCGGKILCSETEGKVIRKKGLELDETLQFVPQKWASDFDVIPFPGHTPGGLAFLWSGSTEKCLFVGDAFIPSGDTWEFYVKEKDSKTMENSLENLQNVEFDRILFSSFSVIGEPSLKIKKIQKEKFLNELMSTLRANNGVKKK